MQNDTEMGYRVYFTTHAFVQLLREIEDFPGIETGGIFVGRRIENTFFIFECVDSGIHCEHTEVEFERDYEYTEHLSYVVASMYKDAKPIGYYHRHPGNFNRFSGGDGASNKEMARLLNGCISGLVTICPNFRLDIWYVDLNGQLSLTNNFEVNDKVFENLMQLKSINDLVTAIEKNEYNFNLKCGRVQKPSSVSHDAGRYQINADETIGEGRRSLITQVEETEGLPGQSQNKSEFIKVERKQKRGIISRLFGEHPQPYSLYMHNEMSKQGESIYNFIKYDIDKLLQKFDIFCKEIDQYFVLIIKNERVSINLLLMPKKVDNEVDLFVIFNDENDKKQEIKYKQGTICHLLRAFS